MSRFPDAEMENSKWKSTKKLGLRCAVWARWSYYAKSPTHDVNIWDMFRKLEKESVPYRVFIAKLGVHIYSDTEKNDAIEKAHGKCEVWKTHPDRPQLLGLHEGGILIFAVNAQHLQVF